MSKYTHYTEQQKEQARMTDIGDLLRRQGVKVRRAGSEQEWLDGGQKVSIKGNTSFISERNYGYKYTAAFVIVVIAVYNVAKLSYGIC